MGDRRLQRIRRVNAKRPPPARLEIYPVPANDETDAILDYITLLLDERDAVRKG